MVGQKAKWTYSELPDVLKSGKDGIKIGPFGSQLKKEFLVNNGPYRVYGQENIYVNDFRIGSRYISKEKFADLQSCELLPGDIVISTMGTIGKCAIVPDYIVKGIMDSHLIRLRLNQDINKRYFQYYIQSELIQKQIQDLSVGGIMDGLSTSIIKKLVITVPPLPEQRAIAEALSDADSYIASLEKLIAKKKAIKQGAMQELLTGKRRLPGFDGEWVSINLAKKSILKARIGWQGLTTAEYRNEGYAYLITGTDFLNGRIDWNGCHYVDKFRFDQDTNIQVKNGDVLITKDGTIGKVALVEGLEKKATLNSGVFVIRPINGAYNNLFVYFVLLSEIFTDFLAKLSAGSTINHLYQKDFVGFEFLAPSTIAEQRAIAQVLIDMDGEIKALTAKLNKAKLIKQGMMQELLTGRIRLVQPEAESVVMSDAIPVTGRKKDTVPASAAPQGHNQQFDDAVMIAGIVNAFYTDRYPLGRKKVQKLLYFLRRKQDESTIAFKKKAAGPYADEVRYRGGELIAKSNRYIATTTTKGKGTTFAQGKNIGQALDYIERWGRQKDIAWLADKFRYTSVDDLELLATVDMAICDLEETGTPISVASIKHLIATNKVWRAKLQKKTFADSKIAQAISDLQTLL